MYIVQAMSLRCDVQVIPLWDQTSDVTFFVIVQQKMMHKAVTVR